MCMYQCYRVKRVAALMEIMSYGDATRETSLPSTFSPSDHLPLLTEFHLEQR